MIRKIDGGFGIAGMLTGIFLLIFVIFPVSFFIIEKGIFNTKACFIRDAVDMANLSLYNAMNAESLSACAIEFDQTRMIDIYKKILARNLKLDDGLMPLEGSIAANGVTIKSLEAYISGLPLTCPLGTGLKRPSIHSVVTVPLRPSFYRGILSAITGVEYYDYTIHADTDLPVNN